MKIFSNYGCEILEREGRFFIRFDSGQSAGASSIEKEISHEQMQKAKVSEQDAYEVILRLEQ
ncbi:hypothetical protein HHX48_11830 [Salinimonas sp. HHU 13199]|uniref:Uncharacterized protein n=1 Tax=Salinimonas profundi TaxID=2729140 RepID=A0ABR8LQR5_9ALTE|nr:hypothetical protein [Salinimonas profundi]MBD3586429.1 hypothetical protein [Salinimonas profundi]